LWEEDKGEPRQPFSPVLKICEEIIPSEETGKPGDQGSVDDGSNKESFGKHAQSI
jgi:hypothetical protein